MPSIPVPFFQYLLEPPQPIVRFPVSLADILGDAP